MRFNRRILGSALAVVSCIATARIATAESFGVQFQGNGTALQSSDIAGLYPQSNYNILPGSSFGTSQTLSDDSGNTAGFTSDAGGTYSTGNPSGADEKLNSGLVNGGGTRTFTITSIPYSQYKLVVYELDNNPRTQGTTLNGNSATTVWGESPAGNAAGYVDGDSTTHYTYIPAASISESSPTVGADYAEFDNLSGSTLAFSVVAPGGDPGDGNGNVFVNGFQIVATPEPISFALLAVAASALLARRPNAKIIGRA